MKLTLLFVVLFLACLLASVEARRRKKNKKNKGPKSNCAKPPKGCKSQRAQYSCQNPIYNGCQWSCGPGGKWCVDIFIILISCDILWISCHALKQYCDIMPSGYTHGCCYIIS
jgi:hypothetical protein